MNGDPNWVQVLEIMYEEGDYQSLDSLLQNYDLDLKVNEAQRKEGIGDMFDFEKGTTGLLLVISLQNLNKLGFITTFDEKDSETEVDFRPDTRFILTESGFQVVHDRKLQQRQRKVMDRTNKAYWIIALLTVVLAFGEAVNAAVALGYIG